MMALADQGINPFDIGNVPGNFSGVYPEFSYSVMFARSNDTVAQRATKLIIAALRFRETLPAKSSCAAAPATGTDRDHNLFGRTVNLKKSGLNCNKDVKHADHSTHVVVACNGAYYKLDVLDRHGTIASPQIVLGNIEGIVRAAVATGDAGRRYGIIATCIDKSSVGVFHGDNLDESVRAVDEALFLVAIDALRSPRDENEAARDLHVGNYHSRDYRKSLQLAVLENGFSRRYIQSLCRGRRRRRRALLLVDRSLREPDRPDSAGGGRQYVCPARL